MTIGDRVQYQQIGGGTGEGVAIEVWASGCLLLTQWGTVRLVNQLDVVEAQDDH